MYPTEELKKLELRKLRARLSILAHRQQCIAAGRDLAGTVDTLEMWRQRLTHWRTILKFMPAIFGRSEPVGSWEVGPEDEERPRKRGKMNTLLRWLTIGLKAYNTFRRPR